MAINKLGTEYILEIQNTDKSEGILCCERMFVKVCDDGGGVYLAIKTDNLEPTDEFDNHTVTLSRSDLSGLVKSLEEIFEEHESI